MADNDFNPENKDFEEKTTNNTEDDTFYIPTTAVTSSSLFERLKLPRNLTITGLVTLGVGTISFGLTAINSNLNSPNVADTPTQLQEEKNKDELIAQLKEKHSLGTALSSQKQQFEESQENKRTVKREPTPKSLKNSEIEVEKIKPSPQAVAQIPVKTKQAPVVAAEPPQAVAVSQPEVVEIKPSPVVQAPQIISKEPTPLPQPKAQPTPEIEETEDIDPYKKCQQAAQTAGISVSTENETPVEKVSKQSEQKSKAVLASYPAPTSQVTTSEPVAQEVEFEPTTSQQVESQPQPRRYDIGAGTKSKAKLQNPVVLNGRVNQDQRYPIEVAEDVKSADDEILIPKNTTMMAQVVSASTSGNIQMNVESIVVPAGTGVMQQHLPYDSVQVLARSGTPLKAKTRYPRVAVPKETVIATTRTKATTRSKSLKNSNYSPSRQGRIIALKRRLGSSRNAVRPQLKRYPTLTLKKGTKLQLFVNKSFNL